MIAPLFAAFRGLYECSNQPNPFNHGPGTRCLDNRKPPLSNAESKGGIVGRSLHFSAPIRGLAIPALVLSRWAEQHPCGLV